MKANQYDLCVIGAGSGGVRAARMAATQGAKVVIVEDKPLGGTCVNLGCVPKKLFVYASRFKDSFDYAAGYGWTLPAQPSFYWQKLLEEKNKEINRLNNIYESILLKAGVELIRGRAKFNQSGQIEVNSQTVQSKNYLVCTGGKPFVPQVPGREHVVTSDQLFHLKELPKRIMICGAGYIALEFAGIFNGLGVDTLVVNRGDKLLKSFDKDIQSFLAPEMEKKGVKFKSNHSIVKIDKISHGYRVHFEQGGYEDTDLVVYATGRVPNSSNLGLEHVGVETDERGAIKVDEYFQTSNKFIFALGDVINKVQLTPVAIGEAMVFVANLFNAEKKTMDYRYIPTAVFCQPNIGTVGYSEQEAGAKFKKLAVYKNEFRAMKHTLSGSSERSLMKMIVDLESNRVVGLHVVGEDAGEIVQGFAVALKAGLTKEAFDNTVGIHPTSAEELVTMREVSYTVESP